MKKQVLLLSILVLSLLFTLQFTLADENLSVDTSDNEQSKVNKAYDCLEEKVKDDCSSSLEDNIFTLLAINKCKDEVVSESKNNKECWPKSGCKIKSTAQAILALDESGISTSDAEDWLLSQEEIPQNMIWYLEIESPEATTCKITYDSNQYTINIGEDKRINSGAGSCLSLSEGGWWLRISQACYHKEFEISCDKQFLTTLLFKKTTSSTIHVSDKTSSASAEGTTTEIINSSCFSQGTSCDYEGSLWAALVLNHLDYDISSYIPYLVVMADENEKYLPESFLYLLTGYTDFRTNLLLKQKNNYWDESDDKFYDTALALYPFQYEELQEKTNSKDWLLEIQGKDGCWDGGNIRNNAFILYSIWPKGGYANGDDDDDDCEDAGYYCMSEINCEGQILSEYTCSGVFKCCDTPKSLDTCVEQGGEICNSEQSCVGGTTVEASDLNYGETCCVGGICEVPSPQQSDCEINNGICRSYECDEDEEESFSYTCDYGDKCCIQKTDDGKSYWWIWLLVLLIILVVLAIIFRDKLRPYYIKIKSKFKKTKPGTPGLGSGFPQTPLRRPQRRTMPRKILPPTAQRRPQKRPVQKPKSEIDDVLKKLKDMGK